MKRNTKLTLSAIMAALSATFMLFSYFPYLTYAIPAIAGLFVMVTVIEVNKKWAMLSYFASAVLIFFLAENESKLMYIFFLGYYPVLKAATEGLKNNILEWIIKFLSFNIAVICVYMLFAKLYGISTEDFGILGKYGAFIFLVAGNIVFLLYDIAVSRMAMAYVSVLHPKIKKILK